MADEITIWSGIKVENGSFKHHANVQAETFDQATAGGGNPGTVNIGTTEESVALGDITTEGWCHLRNLDSTNYVQWGFSTGVYGGRMEAGEPAGPFRLEPSATLYMKANTAACNVQVLVFED